MRTRARSERSGAARPCVAASSLIPAAAGADGAVEHGQLLAGEAAEQELDQLGEEEPACLERVRLTARGQVERVERGRLLAASGR